MYSIQLLDEAIRDLRDLDRSVALRIKRKLEWLSENFERIEPLWLRGDLSGLAKVREGDYRIIYEPRENERLIVVYFVGHRSQVYKQR